MKTLPSALKSVVAGLAFLSAGATTLHAGSDTWSGAGANSNWGTAGNWSSASAHLPPVSGDSLIFSGSTRLTANNNLSAFSFAGLAFNAAAGPFTLTGNSLTLTGYLVDNSPNQETINLPLSLNTSQNITVAGGGSLVIGGVISGAGQIINNGQGTLTLDGNNTYTGSTVVSSGTLAGAGSLNGPVIVGPAGNLGAGDSGGIGVLTLQNTPLTLSGNATLRISKTGGAAVSDNISGISLVTYGGTLTISNITSDSTPLVVGDTFPLFSAITGTSNFTSIVGSPGTGLAYYFDPTNGVLGVEPAIGGGGGPDIDSFLAVNTLDGSTIGVYFDQLVDSGSASQLTNYWVYGKGVGGSINVTNVVLQSDGQSVALYLDSPVGEYYAVAVSNVFNSFGDTIFDATATGYPNDFSTANIGTVSDPDPVGSVFIALPHAFTVTASGSGIGGTNDHFQFVYQEVIGDFDISVQVTNLDASDPDAAAGLLVRDSLNVDSPMALLDVSTGSGALSIQTSGRPSTNATASAFASVSGVSPYPWLRINRTRNSLTAYYGTNGVDWLAISNAFPLVLSSNLYVGAALTSGANGITTTASFASFGVTGARPGDAIIPTVSARIFQTNNVVVSWPVTPEDYAVVLATNLSFSTNTISGGGSTNPPMGWVLVGLPILDSNLTGTNAAMPGLGRYQILPMNIFGNIPIFLRLEKVAKVIPDPLNVTSGMILSEANTNLSPDTSASKICSINVVNTNAVLLVSSNALLCFAGTNYTFTTAPNAPSPVVALQVTAATSNSISMICGTNIASAYANVAEYQVTLKPTKTPTLCTFVAAPTTPVSHNCQIQVQVTYH